MMTTKAPDLYQRRYCNSPSPQNGGARCGGFFDGGQEYEERPCAVVPINGGFSF